MPQTQLKPARNQSIECARLLASIFVIFIHCPFPGKTGQVMDQLARFAVPMFFALSGYFSYRISQETVLNRGKKIFWLDLGATVLYGLWGCFLEKMDGGSAVAFWREAWEEISFPGWFFSNDCPFAIHLWYLNAMLICYLLFWGYLRCFRGRRVTYRPLYILGAAALAVNIALDIVAVWEPAWLSDNVTRNAFFFGLPMFAMGIFLREHGDKIRCRLRAPDWS